MWFLKGKKQLCMCVILLVFSNLANGQQFTQFSSYLINSMGINSAYTGSKDATEVLANYRKQWVKLPGSPQTFMVTANGYFKESKIGLGGVILSDKIGGANSTNFTLNGSYRLKLGDFNLQLGLNGGAQIYKQDLQNLNIVDAEDQVLTEETSSQFLPILGTGVYLFKNDFYFGFSSPDLLESNVINKRRHYYTSVGKVFELNKNLKIKPAILAKYASSSPIQLDLSLSFIYRELFGAGASVRTGAGFVVFGQVYPTEKLTIAMAYDKMTNGLSASEIGTLELTVSHILSMKRATIYSPRYF